MKKKRKRSASSSSSSSASSRNSSASSSSSSSRRRSKKKKKKRRKSERGSKRRSRISSRGSRGSEEGKSEINGREDEVEWYPAPPNTSATFLNQKGGPGFGERDDEEVEEKMGERSVSQLYSLTVSDNEESDSSRREIKRRDSKESRTRRRKSSVSRSPDRKDRGSRSSERKDKYREREKEDKQRNSDSKRRSSLDENRKRKASCSSADSEYSRKSSVRSGYSGNSASKQLENRSKRNSFDGSRYDNREREETCEVEEVKREKERRQGGAEEDWSRSEGGFSKKSESDEQSERSKKALPTNLLDIFNQIAQFEKHKGAGPKK